MGKYVLCVQLLMNFTCCFLHEQIHVAKTQTIKPVILIGTHIYKATIYYSWKQKIKQSSSNNCLGLIYYL